MTLEQQRAARAFSDVQAVAAKHAENSSGRKRYGSLALKLPALVRTAGLCQALHFLQSRNDGGAARTLLVHLAGQLKRVDPKIAGVEVVEDGAEGGTAEGREQAVLQVIDRLLHRIRCAELRDYLRLSREAVAVGNWYSRLTRSVLKVEPGDEPEVETQAAEAPRS